MAEKIMIWAQTNNGTIGNELKIPWHQKKDVQFFKAQTTGQTILMGRNTMASFHGRALPNRLNLVLSHQTDLTMPAGFVLVHSLAEAEKMADARGEKLLIVGGSVVYQTLMADADELLVTYLDTDFVGDTVMDPVDKTIWQGEVIAHDLADDENDFDFEIVRFTRR